ncbi:MAG: HNH endonuclease [Desulfosporosinus sp.]|nr:HNH endonuclease [Desulfosporosinus sp.]
MPNTYRIAEDGSHVIGVFPDRTEFLIDVEDYEKVKLYTWYKNIDGYAVTRRDGKTTRLHRLLMEVPDYLQVDHINRNKCDNRRSNLRFATNKENARNVGLQKNSSTGVKGVNYDARINKFRARIRVDGRLIHLGHFSNLIDASGAYDRAALHYFGEFAFLNNLNVAMEVTTTPPP